MSSPRTKPSRTSLVAFALFVVLPILYVLSYAPVVRVCDRQFPIVGDPQKPPMADAFLYPEYQPVDWLIDSTPLREPLFEHGRDLPVQRLSPREQLRLVRGVLKQRVLEGVVSLGRSSTPMNYLGAHELVERAAK